MLRPVKPPFAVRQVLVCTNQRDPSTGKASCGMNGSLGLRERLKAEIKSRGLKGRVIVTGTSCLDYCPAQGCAVGFHPDGEFFLADVNDDQLILDRLLKGVEGG
jgi:predicted metal-binding protein